MTDSLAMLALLIGLELVLGIDNILVISILVSKIEKAKRDFARIFGLSLAMAVRILMLFILLKLATLTDKVWVIITAVIASFAVLLFFAKPVGEFILKRPSIKILVLSFLITIGITIFMEGMHKHVPKAYIYLPMGFALFVEALQLRYEHNKVKKKKVGST